MDLLKKKFIYRNLIQLFFLIVFTILVFRGFTQLWIIIFGISLLISLFWGRFYCGWICPINTVIRIKDWIYKKLGINVIKTPKFVKKSWLRWIILLLFVISIFISRRNNIQLNMLLYVLIAAFIITLIFDEEIWHKYLCPYGALMSLTNKANSKKLEIDEQKCKKCGLCVQNCPNNIIEITQEKQNIAESECLYCFKCQDVCEFDAISYQKVNK